MKKTTPNRSPKKLTLNRETVRAMTDTQEQEILAAVQGGAYPNTVWCTKVTVTIILCKTG
jgi:hypothetical protein